MPHLCPKSPGFRLPVLVRWSANRDRKRTLPPLYRQSRITWRMSCRDWSGERVVSLSASNRRTAAVSSACLATDTPSSLQPPQIAPTPATPPEAHDGQRARAGARVSAGGQRDHPDCQQLGKFPGVAGDLAELAPEPEALQHMSPRRRLASNARWSCMSAAYRSTIGRSCHPISRIRSPSDPRPASQSFAKVPEHVRVNRVRVVARLLCPPVEHLVDAGPGHRPSVAATQPQRSQPCHPVRSASAEISRQRLRRRHHERHQPPL